MSGTATPYFGTRLDAATSFSGLCVAEGKPLYSEDTAADPRVDREASPGRRRLDDLHAAAP